ncbi:hypothetical protein GCM10007964_74050 [Sphaerisporangium melleum]|uniref:Uncharacterized protein n=1 Tax=Sphaerisporangium melleum TaxID=321316 RepID=A0A917VWF9_9ACTN|nr:hypothetical protein GCM10007964_74050 [Sphaerisporangium melleum]
MAQLAGETVRPVEEPAAGDDAAADADLTGEVDQVGGAEGDPRGVLGERGEVGVVVDGDGHVRGDARGQQRIGHRHALPAQVGGHDDGPAGGVDQTGNGDRDPRQRDSERVEIGDGPADHLDELVERASGLRPHGVEADPPVDEHAPRQVGGEGGDVVDVDLQAQSADA